MFNVLDYGATGNGVTDDAPAFRAAVAAAKTAGGGDIYVPGSPNPYLFASSVTVTLTEGGASAPTQVCVPIDGDNITLRGDGVGQTVLRLANNMNAKVVGFGWSKNNAIEKIEIDANRDNQTTDSIALYSIGDLTNFTARDLFCHHSFKYNVGMSHGKLINTLFDNILMEDSGQDGFDNKNSDGGDFNNRMNNITVRRAGLNTALSGQACIDLRGKWILSGIQCLDFNHTTARCKTGVRFRPDNENDGAIGGNLSSLTNFYINPGSTSGTIGVEMNAYNCSVTNGIVENAGVGVLTNNTENSVGDVIARSCGDGFFADASSTTTGDRNTFVGCLARSCTSGFKVATPKCVLSGIMASSNTAHGINLRNGSSNTVISGVSTSNASSNLNQESTSCTWKDAGLLK